MRALLLAAGLGTRLRPITNDTPKCLVPINGRPLLDIWVETLVCSGVKEILVNAHYLHNQVKEYVNNSKYKNLILIQYEEELLGTAGTLIKNSSFLEDEGGLLIHADNLCLSGLEPFYKSHYNRPNHCLMTMMTFISQNPSSCGVIDIDKIGVVQKFYEKVKNPPSNIANGAIYFLSKEFIRKIIKMDNLFDFSIDVIPEFMGKIYTHPADNLLIDIGNHESYKKANLMLAKNL